MSLPHVIAISHHRETDQRVSSAGLIARVQHYTQHKQVGQRPCSPVARHFFFSPDGVVSINVSATLTRHGK
jgi:hypothetical protein